MIFRFTLLLFTIVSFFGCRNQPEATQVADDGEARIRHASGLSIVGHDGFSVVKVQDPWPNATRSYQYVLFKSGAKVPDSLRHHPMIQVPVKRIVVTSTTHIPSLEMLEMDHTLVGFPNLDYISSEKIRDRIDASEIEELGANQSMNVEKVIDLAPDVLIGFGIENSNPTLDKLQRSGIRIILNGDWNERTPLGKAEWIKLFGALFDKTAEADSIFNKIESDYIRLKQLAATAKSKPTVLAGSIFENRWYMPQGDSWGAIIIKDAGGKYIWENSSGTGSLSLPTEKVLEQAQSADIWMGPEMATLKQMREANPHYSRFKAFQNGNVYNFTGRKGRTGGITYYELGPNRPDLVLKDVISILHPTLLPDHQTYFFHKLR